MHVSAFVYLCYLPGGLPSHRQCVPCFLVKGRPVAMTRVQVLPLLLLSDRKRIS